jgi:transcriptional regulator with GAF, ATPase, and Fis domain
VLQQKEFERVGGTHSIPFKARVLTATNKNLEQAIKSGEFLDEIGELAPPMQAKRMSFHYVSLRKVRTMLTGRAERHV